MEKKNGLASLRREVGKLRKLVYIDAVTGTGNARMRDLMLEQNVARFGRNKDDFCVIIADLDGLKQINDRLGHAAGDRLIKKAANIMKRVVREYDTVCRTGGDEFFIIMPESHYAQGTKLAARLMGECSKSGISISVGIASLYEHFSKEGLTTKGIADKIVHLADARMYDMKREHKNIIANITSKIFRSSR